jgi:23S rRNA (cytosine1962-C5)-methyltransferase
LFHGHEWVYATDIKLRTGDPQPGEVVTLQDVRGKPLGSAIYNPKSQIIARRFSYRRQDLDADFFVRRIERAWNLRQSLGIDTTLCRVVWSESDGLPGLILDRYGDHVVIQTLTLAMSLREELIVEAIKQVLKPQSITARNEVAVRRAEGMECGKSMLFGEQPAPFSLTTAGMKFKIDVFDGQKTGLYLDQLDNYSAVARWAKDRRVLDCFCNQGGFAQACALAGAASVMGIDSSESALASAAQNASELNISWKEANVFDFLKESESKGDTSDLIVLDPPSFTKTKGSVNDALRGYKEIHLRAMKMLKPGGILATFSCSHHISTGDFYTMIGDAAVDARRKLRLIDTYRQRADHPIILGMPETEYLRGYAFEVVGGW